MSDVAFWVMHIVGGLLAAFGAFMLLLLGGLAYVMSQFEDEDRFW